MTLTSWRPGGGGGDHVALFSEVFFTKVAHLHRVDHSAFSASAAPPATISLTTQKGHGATYAFIQLRMSKIRTVLKQRVLRNSSHIVGWTFSVEVAGAERRQLEILRKCQRATTEGVNNLISENSVEEECSEKLLQKMVWRIEGVCFIESYSACECLCESVPSSKRFLGGCLPFAFCRMH